LLIATGDCSNKQNSTNLIILPAITLTILYLYFCNAIGHATQVRRATTAVKTCAVDEATVPSVLRKWNGVSASTTGAVMSSARFAADGWTLTSVTNQADTHRMDSVTKDTMWRVKLLVHASCTR
jgi:hypothetical protein